MPDYSLDPCPFGCGNFVDESYGYCFDCEKRFCPQCKGTVSSYWMNCECCSGLQCDNKDCDWII